MKRAFGWGLFVVLTPIIFIGMTSHLIIDAFTYGWRLMAEWLGGIDE